MAADRLLHNGVTAREQIRKDLLLQGDSRLLRGSLIVNPVREETFARLTRSGLWTSTMRILPAFICATVFADCIAVLRAERVRWHQKRSRKRVAQVGGFLFFGVAPLMALVEAPSIMLIGIMSLCGQFGTWDLPFYLHTYFNSLMAGQVSTLTHNRAHAT